MAKKDLENVQSDASTKAEDKKSLSAQVLRVRTNLAAGCGRCIMYASQTVLIVKC